MSDFKECVVRMLQRTVLMLKPNGSVSCAWLGHSYVKWYKPVALKMHCMGAGNLLLEHILIAFQLLCSMILLIQCEKGCSVNGSDWGHF